MRCPCHCWRAAATLRPSFGPQVSTTSRSDDDILEVPILVADVAVVRTTLGATLLNWAAGLPTVAFAPPTPRRPDTGKVLAGSSELLRKGAGTRPRGGVLPAWLLPTRLLFFTKLFLADLATTGERLRSECPEAADLRIKAMSCAELRGAWRDLLSGWKTPTHNCTTGTDTLNRPRPNTQNISDVEHCEWTRPL